eukprot:12925119-Prorocentrum_lima.AAC.1
MMKQQLKEMKLPSPSKKEITARQDQQEVRREELYSPKATQEEASKSFARGFINPAAGGLKSMPVTSKEVADS